MLGIDREWPELFDAMLELLDDRRRKQTRGELAQAARKQFGRGA